ncbi:MAG: hypothetical protein KGJ75_16485 [Alphaproteobacteria bacterium]|nr:hypothetical protein [Alphaproteobacteria bacterium]MDE2074372.1 hypothetical protein [Alphaproteobacteria bacterium]
MRALESVSRSPLQRFFYWLLVWKPVQRRRTQLSRQVDAAFDSTIGYGPFKGQRLTPGNWWGVKERACMILGLYEQEILHSLMAVPIGYSTFIDLGAGDGYYAVGALVSGRFRNAYCFEMSAEGRRVIADNARLNRVADRLTIHGAAGADFYRAIPDVHLKDSVLFIDIEGGEFDICGPEMFEAFRNSVIFIELHSFFYADGQARYERLVRDAEKWFAVTAMTTGARDLSQFPELDRYDDTDRWLICSEGRKQRMQWLRLDPKAAGAAS